MQKIILPDILDKSVTTKNASLEALVYISSFARYLKIIGNTEILVNISQDTGISNERFLDELQRDESMKVYLRAYHDYITYPNKNYIISRNLAKALSETKVDVKGKYLPKKFNGFIEIEGLLDRDGDEIKGIFVSIQNDFLAMGYLTYNFANKTYGIGHANYDLPKEEELIEEKIKQFRHVDRGSNFRDKSREEIMSLLDKGVTPDTVYTPSEYDPFLSTIINSLLYINSCQDLNESLNVFSKKKSKLEGEIKNFTRKPFVLLGKDFVYPKVYSDSEVVVRGHWRWQPYGPQWSLIKHIYIQPHFRNKQET